MDRRELIQTLIDKKQYKTYLEIGVLGGYVFFDVRCRRKIAVDPSFKINWKGRVGQMFRNASNIRAKFFEVTSDDFFRLHAPSALTKGSLDIALIDGMHEFKYALNDVINALEYLSDDGILIMHDCNPLTAEAACSFEEWKERGFSGYWNGDVWKVILYLTSSRPDLEIFVADCDHGLGVIKKGKRKIESDKFSSYKAVDELTYDDLAENRNLFLNLKPQSYLDVFCKNAVVNNEV